jgi:hypothetical protein
MVYGTWKAAPIRAAERFSTCEIGSRLMTSAEHDRRFFDSPGDADRDWAKLNPCFARILRELIRRANAAGLRVALYEGARSLERQATLFRRGRTDPGAIVTSADGVERLSWHQRGVAADLHFVDSAGNWIQPNFTPVRSWEQLASIGRALGLECGNDWKSRDRVHFEAPYFADLTSEQLDACRE